MSNSVTMKLNDVARIERGRFSPRPRNDPRYYDGDIPFVQTGDVSRAGTYIQEYSQTLNEEGLAVSKLFPKNTILMTIAANVGDVAILDFDSACPDSLVAFTPKEGINNKWLFHVLSTMKKKFDSLSTQNAQKNLSLEKIKPVKIHVPPFKFQENIASTFDVWDTAIEKTEALIAAKERRFEWLQNRLINGKSGNWFSKAIKEISSTKKGQQINRDTLDDAGLHPVWNGGITPSGFTDKSNTPASTITISEGGNSCGFVNFCDEDFWLGGHCYAIEKLHPSVNPDFLFFFLKANERRIMRLRVGSGLPNIQKKDIEKLQIQYPDITEQKRIAETLNTARQEITLLKKLADQYRTQKRGLMQKLLTGKWRIENG